MKYVMVHTISSIWTITQSLEMIIQRQYKPMKCESDNVSFPVVDYELNSTSAPREDMCTQTETKTEV